MISKTCKHLKRSKVMHFELPYVLCYDATVAVAESRSSRWVKYKKVTKKNTRPQTYIFGFYMPWGSKIYENENIPSGAFEKKSKNRFLCSRNQGQRGAF